MQNTFLRLFLVVLSTVSVFAQTMPNEKSFIGFSAENIAKQKALEAKFDASFKRENLVNWLKRLSARPHQVGSSYGKENAEFMDSLFKSRGYDAKIEQFDVLFPTPKTRILEMISPQKFTAKLDEPALKEDVIPSWVKKQDSNFNNEGRNRRSRQF